MTVGGGGGGDVGGGGVGGGSGRVVCGCCAVVGRRERDAWCGEPASVPVAGRRDGGGLLGWVRRVRVSVVWCDGAAGWCEACWPPACGAAERGW